MMQNLFLSIAESQTETALFYPSPLEGSMDFTAAFIKVVVVMTVVCALAFVVIKYLFPRAYTWKRGGDSRIRVEERVCLEPKKNLYLLKVDSKYLLVGTSESTLHSLLSWEEEIPKG